jgi:predicted PurR-regulated permease PerM
VTNSRPPQRGAEVPPALATLAGWSWRLLVIGGALVVVAIALASLRLIVLSMFVAVFAAALLRPPTEWLKRGGLPGALAALIVLAVALGLAFGTVVLLVPAFVAQMDELGRNLEAGVKQVGDWLLEGPFDLTEAQLDNSIDRGLEELGNRGDVLASGLLGGAMLLAELIAGLLLALVLTFFFLKDGDWMWRWLVELLPPAHRTAAREIGGRSWSTLAGYLRGVTIVALFDATFIGLALVLLGVPAALPLAVLTFFGAYIPIAGAFLTGIAAVLVALVSDGLATAGLVAAAVIVVQQVESNILQPVVVGRAVALHPVVILLAVTSAALVAGVLGALVAVPIVALAARVFDYLREAREDPDARELTTQMGDGPDPTAAAQARSSPS